MAKIIDKTEDLLRAVNSIQGGEPIGPIESGENDSSEIAALKSKVNDISSELNAMREGPGVDIEEGDKLEPLLSDISIVGQYPVLADDLGAGQYIVKLHEDFIESTDVDEEGGGGEDVDYVFVAKITGESSGDYAWTEQDVSTIGVLTDKDDGRSGTTSIDAAKELNGTEDLYLDDFYAVMIEFFDDDGDPHYFFTKGDAGTHSSPLDLTVTPGTSTARTATWDVTSQGVNDGVTVYRERTFWDSPSIKGAWWDEVYDSTGRLVSSTAETVFTIITFTNFVCPA